MENHAEKVWDDIGRPPFFVIDAWPLTRPNVIAICDPELMERIVKASPEHPTSLPKSVTYADLHILFTPDSIVRNVGPPWKQLRKMYSPGFSAKNLQRMLPDLIPEIKIFAARLDKAVGKTITLGEFTTALTIDIIGIVVLGRSFNAQRTSSALLNGFFQCINWQIRQESINPFHLFNPLRPIAHAYYGRKLDTAVDEQVRATLSEKNSLNERSVINLAMLEHDATSTEDFVQASRAQVKTFLLAGHDTTSTFLQYAYYELGRRPEMLEQMRAEHRAIFGQEMKGYHDRVEQALAETPEKVLAAMAYTMGFMKEVGSLSHTRNASSLSLSRPLDSGASPRQAVLRHLATISLPSGMGKAIALMDMSVLLCFHLVRSVRLNHIQTLPTVDICVRKNPRFYGPDASEFKPERWLDSAEWKIPAMAFRPFERGPRACIAQV